MPFVLGAITQGPLVDGPRSQTGASAPLLRLAAGHRRGLELLRRFVDLSWRGWAFVLVGVLWELFAVVLSRRAGWGWDKGELFFGWGVGVLALGFWLRRGRGRPAVSRVFLVVNLLVMAVLSVVVGTR